MLDFQSWPRRRWKQLGSFLAIGGFLYTCNNLLAGRVLQGHSANTAPTKPPGWFDQPYRPKDDFNSLHFDEKQCTDYFPGLTKDIDDYSDLGPFDLKPTGNLGPLQVRVKDGELYILHPIREEPLAPELLDSQTSTLHQIHRAVITSPSPVPNTIFAINIQDQPFGTAFSYSRPAYAAPTANNPPITRAFLMPHFSFWAWNLPFIGSFTRAAAAIETFEAHASFQSKDSRVAWRGTTRFYGSHNPHLRQNLLDVTRGADWADVEALKWERDDDMGNGNNTASNAMMIEDFCKYKYVAHTEGVTYSGRLQFLQLCNSVLLTPPLAWLQHTTHLVKPVFSHDLYFGYIAKKPWKSSSNIQKAWPVHYPPDQANAVFVAPDWSDLEETVKWLEANPNTAAGIARRQRELYATRGYLSPAAEVCYWRALLKGWSKAARITPEEWEGIEEVKWELYAMGHTR